MLDFRPKISIKQNKPFHLHKLAFVIKLSFHLSEHTHSFKTQMQMTCFISVGPGNRKFAQGPHSSPSPLHFVNVYNKFRQAKIRAEEIQQATMTMPL